MGVSLTSNINGAAERHKCLKVFESLWGSFSDIYVLQETDLADLWQGNVWEGQCTWSPASNRPAGVAVLIHQNSAAKLVDSKTDLAGRVVLLSLNFTDNGFK